MTVLNQLHGLQMHVEDLAAWVLLVATVVGILFCIWLFVDTLLTYSSRRTR